MTGDQADFEVRCEWGKQGVLRLAPISDVVVIVDVLSFSTCVDVATSQGAIAFPYQWNDESAEAFAQSIGAELAGKRGSSRYSLSPVSLLGIGSGTRLVLPSPNGASLSLSTASTPTFAGSLRNCRAVASAIMGYGRRIAVIPAGKKWLDGSLRPAIEDWVGAGAIISYLERHLSPEAQLAKLAYQALDQPTRSLVELLKRCSSGQELVERGFESDVELASQVNVSCYAPALIDGAYRNMHTPL